MNQRIKYMGLFVFLIAVIVLVPNYAHAAQQKTNDAYAHPPRTALYDPNLVCGDHVCGPYEVPHHPQLKK